MVYFTKLCPHCQYKYQIRSPVKQQYGSPFRICVRCKKRFVDRDFIEIALLPPQMIRNPKVSLLSIIWLVLGIVFCALLWAPGPILNNTVLVLFPVLGIVLTASDLSGYQERCQYIQNELRRSQARLSDPEYLRALEEIDYDLLPRQIQKTYSPIVPKGSVSKKSIIIPLVVALSLSAILIAGLVFLVLTSL